MDIGIPQETRPRRAPRGARSLGRQDARPAGPPRLGGERTPASPPGHPDADYQSAGATIAYSRMEVFARAELVASVFAPDPPEYGLLRRGPGRVRLLGPARRAAGGLARARSSARSRRWASRRSRTTRGRARCSPHVRDRGQPGGRRWAAGLLLNEFGGKGILLGGVPGVPPANFVILGAGVAGALRGARGARARAPHVTLLDVSVAPPARGARSGCRRASPPCSPRARTSRRRSSFADLVLGAVAVHGERAPVLVTREMLRLMKPRSVVVDLAIDMGGCFETSRPTAFRSPTYEVDGILHFCVPNLPSVAARSATLALTNALAALPPGGGGRRASTRALRGAPRAARAGTYLYRGRCARESLARDLRRATGAPPGVEAGR